MIEALLLLAGVVLLAGCGLFVAAEFALVTVDRASVERAAQAGDRRARGTLAALRTLSTQLSGAQLGITLTNLGIGYLAQPAIAKLLVGPLHRVGVARSVADDLSVTLALVLATVLTMVFGELVPKNVALAQPMQTANSAQRFQRAFTRATLPMITFLNGLANLLLRRFGITPREELASARSAQELFSLVGRSAEHGTLARETATLVQRSLLFGDRTAQDVMTPRVRMRSIGADESVAAVIALTRRTGHSRFPVIGEGSDDVVGLVHIKHAVAVAEDARATTKVRAVMAAPVSVPSTMPLDPLMETLRAGGLQMAIVVDEFGGTDGLVTAEDLIEEIVGDVVDEHDRVSPRAVRHRDGSWALSGLLRPEEAEELTGVRIPTDDAYQTLGGLMATALGRIPAAGDTAVLAGARYTVERMDGRRVDRIRLDMITKGGGADDEDRTDGPRPTTAGVGSGLAPGDVVIDARRPLPPSHPPRGHRHHGQGATSPGQNGSDQPESFRGLGWTAGSARLGWAGWTGGGTRAPGTARGLSAGGSRFGTAAGREGGR